MKRSRVAALIFLVFGLWLIFFLFAGYPSCPPRSPIPNIPNPPSYLLGRNVCIITYDSRWSTNSFRTPYWQNTATALTYYALLHNYRRYHVSEIPDVCPSNANSAWPKPYVLLQYIHKCPTILFMDSDAHVENLDHSVLQLVQLLGMNLTSEPPAFIMAEDRPHPDSFMHSLPQTYMVNTGVIFAFQKPITKEALLRWTWCWRDVEGCEYWLTNWPYDQGGFNEHVRTWLPEGELQVASCDLANGFYKDYQCRGKLISHGWFWKKEQGERAMAAVQEHIRCSTPLINLRNPS
jgi:hypothetical protein